MFAKPYKIENTDATIQNCNWYLTSVNGIVPTNEVDDKGNPKYRISSIFDIYELGKEKPFKSQHSEYIEFVDQYGLLGMLEKLYQEKPMEVSIEDIAGNEIEEINLNEE